MVKLQQKNFYFQGGKSSPRSEGKFYFVKLDFASQNKEANPLLVQRNSDFASQNKEDWI